MLLFKWDWVYSLIQTWQYSATPLFMCSTSGLQLLLYSLVKHTDLKYCTVLLQTSAQKRVFLFNIAIKKTHLQLRNVHEAEVLQWRFSPPLYRYYESLLIKFLRLLIWTPINFCKDHKSSPVITREYGAISLLLASEWTCKARWSIQA